MKAVHQFATFEKILESYSLDQPLFRFLAQFYRDHKQMGSRDRKIASRLIYNYFRLGDVLKDETTLNRLVVAEFLVNDIPNSFLEHYHPAWNQLIGIELQEKLRLIKDAFSDFMLAPVFPFNEYLSDGIESPRFFRSSFVQPDLFIRVVRGKEKIVKKILGESEVPFQQVSMQTFALPNGTKLDLLLPDKRIYEVQDRSSQAVGDYFKPQKWEKWWDCCAASGGKSLLLLDEQPEIKLLVTDNRASILENLKARFNHASIRNYQLKCLDLTESQDLFLHDYEFDGIIYDAPCSGSGTWGRSPEMLAQFQAHKIQFFVELQRNIAKNIVKYLKQGKPLIYITCSVFKQENEEQVNWLCKNFGFEIQNQLLIKGYEHKADTMFVARLIKL